MDNVLAGRRLRAAIACLALALCTTSAWDRRGSRPTPKPPDTVQHEHGSRSVTPSERAEAAKRAETRRQEETSRLAKEHQVTDSEAKDRVADYERSIRDLGLDPRYAPQALALATVAADASLRKELLYGRLEGEYSWLHAQIAESNHDTALLALTTIAARKAFDRPLNLEKVAVAVSGLSRSSTRAIEQVVPKVNRIDLRNLSNVVFDPKFDPTSEAGVASMAFALRSHSGKLLVLLSHHDAVAGTVQLAGKGSRTRPVPVSALRRAADLAEVGLFLLGCDTQASTALGTRTQITPKQAASGLKRLFESELVTLGEVFRRLAGDDFLLTFDLRFDVHQKLGVDERSADQPSTADAVRGEPREAWTVPVIGQPPSLASAVDRANQQRIAQLVDDVQDYGLVFANASCNELRNELRRLAFPPSVGGRKVLRSLMTQKNCPEFDLSLRGVMNPVQTSFPPPRFSTESSTSPTPSVSWLGWLFYAALAMLCLVALFAMLNRLVR